MTQPVDLWSLSLFIHSTNVVMNYSEVETKVREATNDETWGPHGSLMSELAKYTFTYEHFPETMAMLWRRMFESKKNWRRTYKVWNALLRVFTTSLQVYLKSCITSTNIDYMYNKLLAMFVQ